MSLLPFIIRGLSSSPNVPTIAETDQEIFGIQTPNLTYSAYRMSGLCITNNKTVLATATAFYGQNNSDGLPSDVLLLRSVDGMKTWQDSRVVGAHNGVIAKSRAYEGTLLVDRSNNRSYCLYTTIDEPDNLTARLPVPAFGVYTYDIMLTFSDDDGLTWSTPTSLKSIVDAKHPDSIYLTLSGPGQGVQLTNGNLIFTCYVGRKHNDNAYRFDGMTIYSTNNGATWQAGAINPISATEANGFELTENVLLVNTRNGSFREVYTTSNNGETYAPHASDDLIPCVNVYGSTEKIPANGGSRPNDYYLFSMPESSVNRENINIKASLNYVNWTTNLRVLEEPNSRGYSSLTYYNGMLACIYESSSEGTNNKLTIRAVNLSEEIQKYYDAAAAL